jgi:AcrR family transcriptional regulator
MPRGYSTLSRQRILDVAAELAATEGIDQLKMRELAAALGVGTMSVYHHLPDKRSLTYALAEHLWARMELPDPSRAWTERMRAITTQVWTTAARYPGLVPLLLTRRFTGPEGLPAVEALLHAARDAGFDAAGSVRCFRVLIGYAVGVAEAETARARLKDDDPLRRVRDDPAARLRFPNLYDSLDAAQHSSSTEEFNFGLELLIDGLARSVHRAS